MAAKKVSTSKMAKAKPKPKAAKPRPTKSGKPWKDATRRGGVVSQVEGRLGIALTKAEGNAPVQAYYNALPLGQKAIGKRIDAILAREIPGVRKAIKWHNPMYNAGRGWIVGVASYKSYVQVMWFKGTSLNPVPHGGKQEDARFINIRDEAELDEDLMASWARQAAQLPGEWPTT